ncbi:hypothetical protein NECID01_0556 [Nematocida sp. AWRm77]|nr:hypothetical protein NECID01_0556 [Nematocida sp. AWRm77]
MKKHKYVSDSLLVQKKKAIEERMLYWMEAAEKEDADGAYEEEVIQDLQTCAENSDMEEASALLQSITGILPLLEEPGMCVDGLLRLVLLRKRISVYGMLGIVLIISNHGAEVPSFFELLHSLMEPSLFEEECDALSTLCDTVLRSENLSLKGTQRLLKRLSWVSVRVGAVHSARIMQVISRGLLRHKRANVLYKEKEERENTADYDSFQPYLFEIDAFKDHPILSESARKIKSGLVVDPEEEESILERAKKVYLYGSCR